jgi:hypothetical protein
VLDVVDCNPTDHASGGGRVGVESGEEGSHARVEGGTTVETEPAEPDEDLLDISVSSAA